MTNQKSPKSPPTLSNPLDMLYGNEDIPDEKVEVFGDVLPGYYYACIGKTTRIEGKKRPAVVIDFFLLSYTEDGEETSKGIQLMEYDNKGGKVSIAFKNSKSGKPITSTVFKLFLNEPIAMDASGTINFFNKTKRLIALGFGAFDKDSQTVQWSKIRSLVGRFCSFKLESSKDGSGFMRLIPETLVTLDESILSSPDNIKELYNIVESEREKREAAKTGMSSPQKAKSFEEFEDEAESEGAKDGLPF